MDVLDSRGPRRIKFSLDELKFAQELCFPADFRRLIKKHSEGTPLAYFWQSLDVSFRQIHKGDLLSFVFTHSRADFENGFGELLEKIIIDLIDRGQPEDQKQ